MAVPGRAARASGVEALASAAQSEGAAHASGVEDLASFAQPEGAARASGVEALASLAQREGSQHACAADSGASADAVAPSGLAWLLSQPIRLYRWLLSPLLPPSCRFHPSCSRYALQALAVHGAGRGSWLTAGRLLRCHPFCDGGVDPVPPPRG